MTDIVSTLRNLLTPYPFHQEKKGFYGYYLFRGRQRKLVFFVHPTMSGTVYFGISHHGTSIMRNYPLLQSACDVWKMAIMKRRIDSVEDIETKGIVDLIRICYECVTNHDGYTYEKTTSAVLVPPPNDDRLSDHNTYGQ